MLYLSVYHGNATYYNSHHELESNFYCCLMLKRICLSLLRMLIRQDITRASRHLLRPFNKSSLLFIPIHLVQMTLRSLFEFTNPTRNTTNLDDQVWHCKPSACSRTRPVRRLGDCRVRWGTLLNLVLCFHRKRTPRKCTAWFQELSRWRLRVRPLEQW